MLPTPMHPMTILLLGEVVPFSPNTRDGITVGNPNRPADSALQRFMKERRVSKELIVMILPRVIEVVRKGGWRP